jgi:hypothetical protein
VKWQTDADVEIPKCSLAISPAFLSKITLLQKIIFAYTIICLSLPHEAE